MKKKNGFTLIELMAVLSILAILLLILGVTFIQSQKLLNKISIQNNEQDDVRNAILQIETLANNAEEIIVSNSVDYSLERKLLISIVKNNIEYKIILNCALVDNGIIYYLNNLTILLSFSFFIS